MVCSNTVRVIRNSLVEDLSGCLKKSPILITTGILIRQMLNIEKENRQT